MFSKLSWINQYKPYFKIFLIARIRGLKYGEGYLLKAERGRQNSDISALAIVTLGDHAASMRA